MSEEIGIGEMRAEALREIKMRRWVYPRWVEAGRMTQADADRRIAVMQAIADHFKEKGLFDV